MSRDVYTEQDHQAAVRDDLRRIADALEALVDHLVPTPPEPWGRSECTVCDYYSTGPRSFVTQKSGGHFAATGHPVNVTEADQ